MRDGPNCKDLIPKSLANFHERGGTVEVPEYGNALPTLGYGAEYIWSSLFHNCPSHRTGVYAMMELPSGGLSDHEITGKYD